MPEKIIYVFADWIEEKPVLIGNLFVSFIRGKEMFSFEYNEEWLHRKEANYILDPNLQLCIGRQYLPNDKTIFGIFSDSCPDRWGRFLMQRREANIARKEERKPKSLNESDYLLGVYDESRMGGLRFSLEKDGPFLSNDEDMSTPPWVKLRSIEAAAYSFEEAELKEEEKWLKMLIAPGSSLGGARPKASVTMPDGTIWIAKFPKKHDEINTGAWEMVAHDLAQMCDLNVSEAKIHKFSQNGSTFLTKRFDRVHGRRIHFASAMTLLGKSDGEHDVGYLDIASFIRQNGATPNPDLRELWKRIVFSMAISNTDDHLRNHGFLMSKDGWHLSPAYDINPNIYGTELSLYVSQYDSTIDFELALETAKHYNVSNEEAKRYINNVKDIVQRNWVSLATKYNISRSEIERVEPAFIMTKRKSIDDHITEAQKQSFDVESQPQHEEIDR